MNRRIFLAGTSGAILSACAGPALADPRCELTESDIEGPFFLPDAPFRTAHPDSTIHLRGTVRSLGCRPVADAVIEYWHADVHGEYDNQGFTNRGQLRTDEQGRYSLMTILPGRYRNGPTFRPSHYNFKVHANRSPTLTTQTYFPGDPYNDSDPWFRANRVIHLLAPGYRPGPQRASFDFVV